MAMTKNTSVALGDHFDDYISEKLNSGKYRSASEVIREGLRRLENDDLKLEALRTRLAIGEQQAKEGRVVKNFSYESLMSKIDGQIKAKKN